MLAVAALLCASWSPLGASRHPRALHHHRHQRVIATEEMSLLAQLDDLYRMLLVDGPIEIEYAPEQVADQLVGLETHRVVGVHVTPAGWFALALVSLWTLYSPAGLVAYLRDARARDEELPLHLEWVPEYVWPQKHPKEAETVAQVEQSGAEISDE